jgi:hypothetical protein
MDEDPSRLFLTKTHFDFLQLAEEQCKLLTTRNPHDPDEEVKHKKRPAASSSSFENVDEEQVDDYDEDEEYEWWHGPEEFDEFDASVAKEELEELEEFEAPPPVTATATARKSSQAVLPSQTGDATTSSLWFRPVLPISKAPPPWKAPPPVCPKASPPPVLPKASRGPHAKASPPPPPWRMMNVAPVTPPDDPPAQDSQAKPSLLVPKSKPRGPRKKECPPELLDHYRREQARSVLWNLTWDQRGPRPEYGPMPKTWRGGYWSESSRKWRGPRGGAKKEWRDNKYGWAKAKAKS